MKVKVTCLHCGRVHELARRFQEAGKYQLLCCGCETTLFFDVSPNSLAIHNANQMLALALTADPALD
jgi:hypothetical protein